jgi:hypothetical protein
LNAFSALTQHLLFITSAHLCRTPTSRGGYAGPPPRDAASFQRDAIGRLTIEDGLSRVFGSNGGLVEERARGSQSRRGSGHRGGGSSTSEDGVDGAIRRARREETKREEETEGVVCGGQSDDDDVFVV